jgi:hypothetical protein
MNLADFGGLMSMRRVFLHLLLALLTFAIAKMFVGRNTRQPIVPSGGSGSFTYSDGKRTIRLFEYKHDVYPIPSRGY